MNTYGRHRDSIADIEEQLRQIFEEDPACTYNAQDEPIIPGASLVNVVQAFSDAGGIELMSSTEIDQLKQLLAANPAVQVTPGVLVQFVAEKTKHSPPRSPVEETGPPTPFRGRSDDRDASDDQARSSSHSSQETPAGGYRSSSRPPSRNGPPKTPTSSVFDNSRRQRSTPLQNKPPSSWSAKGDFERPPGPRRRKSDAGSHSESEFDSPSTNKGRSRTRAPSNPVSPASNMMGDPRPGSRPHSRARSQPQNQFNNAYHSPNEERDYSSPDDNDETFIRGLNSLPMPRPTSDSDSDPEDDSLVMDREIASSTASMEPEARVDALTRHNRDLQKKLQETERALQRKLTEHDNEIEDMEARLEELRTELNATKREEKDLRAKERQNQGQIAALEAEVAKVQKILDHSRASYTSLQKQYQEQCAASEKYRDDLRQRDEIIRTLREGTSLYDQETSKWAKEQQTYEDRISTIEDELSLAQQAHAQLDEQKQENLLLKETIDRMRFDMDEMRNSASSVAGHSAQSSAANTLSKSLGAELMGKMRWSMTDGEDEEDASGSSEQVTSGGDETEGEDVVHIITRKKRKVASRANKLETTTFEELKEYSDTATQYESNLVTSSVQTLPEPKIPTATVDIQTDEILIPKPVPVVPRVTVEMDVQTDEIEESVSRSPSPEVETMASSSSTIMPSTPKAALQLLDHLSPHDQPPAYTQLSPEEQAQREWSLDAETLKRWHHGLEKLKIPLEGIPGGLSAEFLEDWKALKEELGVECLVIDKIVEKSSKSPATPSKDGKRRGGKFYNIYNTYVYGSKDSPALPQGVATQAALVVGVSAFFLFALTPYLAPHYSIPGGPNYYDRAAWSAYNSMHATGEGFGYDGQTAVWNFLGRVSRGAARTVQGWPT